MECGDSNVKVNPITNSDIITTGYDYTLPLDYDSILTYGGMMKKLIGISLLLFVFGNCTDKKEPSESIYTEEELAIYREDGLKLAMATKAVLGTNLQTAIKTKGTEHALDFCNIKAIPLTDSVSTARKATISRVSDQPRNQDNQATKKETEIIASVKQTIKAGGQPKPTIIPSENKVIGYYPIITNELCMQCHGGENAEIKAETLAKIDELYPNDKATEYGIGEVRGLFKVIMSKKTEH